MLLLLSIQSQQLAFSLYISLSLSAFVNYETLECLPSMCACCRIEGRQERRAESAGIRGGVCCKNSKRGQKRSGGMQLQWHVAHVPRLRATDTGGEFQTLSLQGTRQGANSWGLACVRPAAAKRPPPAPLCLVPPAAPAPARMQSEAPRRADAHFLCASNRPRCCQTGLAYHIHTFDAIQQVHTASARLLLQFAASR